MRALDVKDLEDAFRRAYPHLMKGMAASSHGGFRFDAALVSDPSVNIGVSLGHPGQPGREFRKLNAMKFKASMTHKCSTGQLPETEADQLRAAGVHKGAVHNPDLDVVMSLTGFGPCGNVSWCNFIEAELLDIQAKKVDKAA